MKLNKNKQRILSKLLLSSSSTRHLLQIHAQIYTLGLHQDQFLTTHLISLCRRLSQTQHALSTFSGTCQPTAYPLNSLLEALAAEDSPLLRLQSIDIYKEYIKESRPNNFTFSPLLRACGIFKELTWQLHAHVYKLGVHGDAYVATTLLDCYLKCGDSGAARKVFDEMPERSVVSWNSMVSGLARRGDLVGARKVFDEMPERNEASWTCMLTGYAQNGCFEEAIGLYSEMKSMGVCLNGMAAVSLLSACAGLGALGTGREVHRFLAGKGSGLDLFSCTALIDMYSKCGVVEEAVQVFDEMPEKNVVAFSSMIMGLAVNGRCEEALRVFDRMGMAGLRPNDLTFVGVLCACCHGGFLEEARHYFNSMERSYSVVPKLQHYTCMVDLLGRLGRVDEAFRLIGEMPVEPDVIIWGALLGACRMHGQVELGNYAADRILELDPQHSGGLVFLSSTCARVRNWTGVRKISRRLGTSEKKKIAGKSWVEIDGIVHQFFAGDQTHAQSDEIFAKLAELALLLEQHVYFPDTGICHV